MTALPIGRQRCIACAGVGRSTSDAWTTCVPCDGAGHHWRKGGPRFGATLTLGDAKVGDVVTLATNDRVLVVTQIPKKHPTETRCLVIDDFTDEPESPPITISAELGAISIVPRLKSKDGEDGAGEKDADALDPMAARGRVGEGPLL